MLCPSCNQEAGLVLQDADFESLELKGSTAVIEVVENQFCDQCSATVKTDRFRAVIEIPEAVAHQGDAHHVDLHPEGLQPREDHEGEFQVQFRVVCSCGASIEHEGRAKPLAESVPWQNPSA